MTLSEILTVIPSYLRVYIYIYIYISSILIFVNKFMHFLNIKSESDSNEPSIRHGKVFSLFPWISWSKFSWVIRCKQVAKNKLSFLAYAVSFFEVFPNPIFLFSFISVDNLYNTEILCFFRVNFAKERYIYK